MDRAHLLHQLRRVDLQLLDVGSLNQDIQTVRAATAATTAARSTTHAAARRGAGDVGAARDADASALVLAQHRAHLPHQILLGHVPVFERRHDDVEVREPAVDVAGHPFDELLGQLENLFLDRLHELLGP